jgi:hypothetical protein
VKSGQRYRRFEDVGAEQVVKVADDARRRDLQEFLKKNHFN